MISRAFVSVNAIHVISVYYQRALKVRNLTRTLGMHGLETSQFRFPKNIL